MRPSPWTPALDAQLAALWGRPRAEIVQRLRMTVGQIIGRARILNLHHKAARATPLRPEHPAVGGGRTIFPSRIVEPEDAPRLLKSGRDTTKLGQRVEKGAWRGMPIYSLTLEERATCPRSCAQWRVCYGSAMPFAKRIAHGPALEAGLGRELRVLQQRHPGGFVVRLHMLGDFYSVDYAARWRGWLTDYPALHVFGYTAWPPESRIGHFIAWMRSTAAARFMVRFSGIETRVVGEASEAEGAIICPAQTGKTRSCATCGLCWAPAAAGKVVAFLEHGMRGRRAA